MGKSLFIAEKPSVAQEFAKTLDNSFNSFTRHDGYLESDSYVVTWCVGHLVTMCYPESYDPALRRWQLSTLPFIPNDFKYQVIDTVKKQFNIVSTLLNRPDVTTIYVCTDSGREGEYIYRLVEQMAGVTGKERRRVWIDSQTEEEIKRGIKEAKDLAEYDNLAKAAYLRAIEDYLIGINFSRLLSLKFGPTLAAYLKKDHVVIATGRVMTCVLGMVVNREREIRNFEKTPYYRVCAKAMPFTDDTESSFEAEWKAVAGSFYEGSPKLYKENGFKLREDAQALINSFNLPEEAETVSIEKKTEKKQAPLLFNLAEIQNECSKRYKISPDETLKIIQELYEKKLVTYPRTDARVLSTAAAKEIHKNISGLQYYPPLSEYAKEILADGSFKGLAKTKYVNDKQITDHYAIVPTGQGLNNLKSLSGATAGKVYELICRRFLSIFYPAAEYRKYALELMAPTNTDHNEHFFSNFKILSKEGYLKVWSANMSGNSDVSQVTSDSKSGNQKDSSKNGLNDDDNKVSDLKNDPKLLEYLEHLRKGQKILFASMEIKENETKPPSRYNSGSMILAMENAGQLIEDEELRAQIKGSGIGTSATRAEVLKKLVTNKYISLNQKTQIITPTAFGEAIYDITDVSMKQLLNPAFTASWEKGLTMVANGEITQQEYMDKLEAFIQRRTAIVKDIRNPEAITPRFDASAVYYNKKGSQRN